MQRLSLYIQDLLLNDFVSPRPYIQLQLRLFLFITLFFNGLMTQFTTICTCLMHPKIVSKRVLVTDKWKLTKQNALAIYKTMRNEM